MELHSDCAGRVQIQLALSDQGEDRAALVFRCAGCGAAGEYPGTRAEGEAALEKFAAAGTLRRIASSQALTH